MKNKEIFLIITGNKYPNGDAGSIRQHSFAKILHQLGFEPIIIGMGNTTNFSQIIFDNIKYYSLRYSNNNLFFRALGRLLFANNLRKILFKFDVKNIAAILWVSGDMKTFKLIKCFSKKNRIQLYHDSVEWYSPSEFKNGERNRDYIFNNKMNSTLIDKSFKVIAISRYLENHYKNKGLITERIPVIMDISQIKFNKIESGKIVIVYAGTMSGKDRIHNFLTAFCDLPGDLRRRFEFNIIGLTYEQYCSLGYPLSSCAINNEVHFLGRVNREQVLQELEKANFTVLLRPSKERYSMAGFPTKVVESLATGTPVICNISSDLDLYLTDLNNSIILNDSTYDESKRALYRISKLTDEKFKQMQIESRKTAEKYFNWKLYIDTFDRIINNHE